MLDHAFLQGGYADFDQLMNACAELEKVVNDSLR